VKGDVWSRKRRLVVLAARVPLDDGDYQNDPAYIPDLLRELSKGRCWQFSPVAARTQNSEQEILDKKDVLKLEKSETWLNDQCGLLHKSLNY